MIDNRYGTLVKILDSIRKEAPQALEFSRYRSQKTDDVQYSRGRAYIHLFLQVKFGLSSFEERHRLITDGEQDGGLDAYFISDQQKNVFLIQSKFKNSGAGFAGESIPASDLVRMELERILHGHHKDSNGVMYNQKIVEFQEELDQATRKSAYNHKVIFLANLHSYNEAQIRKLTVNLDYEVFDFQRSYLELVKPVCSGTNFSPDQVVIELDISEKSKPQLSQTVKTSYGDCDVMAVFVPTAELGRVVSRHKNAILQYNPRNYLGLSKNSVNKEIRKSITSRSENDFALLNNGITVLADEQTFSVHTGRENVGRLILVNPQIINGGQTAYTLSEIYEADLKTTPKVFQGKEVLVRVVVLKEGLRNEPRDPRNKRRFIEAISASTNQQTQVKEADRHSSDPTMLEVQRLIFAKYGHFVELKTGEFYDGLARGFLGKTLIVDRIRLLRSYVAFGGRPTAARNHSEPKIYEETFFNSIFAKREGEELAAEMMFAYKLHSTLITIDRQTKGKANKYAASGYGLRYGKYAMVYASSLLMHGEFRSDLGKRNLGEMGDYIVQLVDKLLSKWKGFEEDAKQLKSNQAFFDGEKGIVDFDSYYRGGTLKNDIEAFRWNGDIEGKQGTLALRLAGGEQSPGHLPVTEPDPKPAARSVVAGGGIEPPTKGL